LPPKATLAVHRGVAGSEVFLDGNRVGVVRPDGNFSMEGVDPGKHSVSVQHDRYKPLQSDQVFAAGKSIELDGTLQSAFGTLKIEMNPQVADLHLKIRRQNDNQERDVKETTLSLPEGIYTVFASAPRYQDTTATVRVTPDNTSVATLLMKVVPVVPAVIVAPPAAPSGFTLNDWFKTGEWTRDGQTLRRQGGNFVLVPLNLTAATIRFTGMVLRGRRLEWVAGYRDEKNYYLFQMDDTNFNRTEIADGKRSKTAKVAHQAHRDAYSTFTIEITPRGISHTISHDQSSLALETWEPANGFPPGKFGFNISGRDEIGLTEFRLTPK
jgi:hypothetical protein